MRHYLSRGGFRGRSERVTENGPRMDEAGGAIGPYTLVRPIGEGSFGAVWLAEKRTAIATTRFALKLPHAGNVDARALAREAAIWVQASGHPNVLPLIEADAYDGRVVLVSEFVADGSLHEWLNARGGRGVPADEACGMMDGILAGLAHLHELRIVHRDLKPSNVLLQRGTPRLADFGISRVLRSTSHSARVAGTFAYMAPEAFDGVRDERTDLWAAGVVLYRMLAGRLPFAQRDAPALMHAIMHRDPPPLPDVHPALREVVSRALRRDPASRFASAGEMRDAVAGAARRLWLEDRAGEPTLPAPAAPPSAAPAHPRRAGTATFATAPHPPSPSSSPARAPVAASPAVRARVRRRPAASRRGRAALALLLLAAVAFAGWTWRARAGGTSAAAAEGTYLQTDSLDTGGDIRVVAFSPDGRTLAAGQSKQSTQLWDLQSGKMVRRLAADGRMQQSLEFSPDGRWLLAAARAPRSALEPPDQAAQLWEVGSGQLRRSFPIPTRDSYGSTAWAPQTGILALAAENNVQLWDPESGEPRGTLGGHREPVTAVELTADGQTLASASQDGTVMLWSVRTRRRRWHLDARAGEVWDVAFSPDGGTLAAACDDGTVKLWDVATGMLAATLRGHRESVTRVEFSPDGTYLLSLSGGEETGILWDAATGRLRSFLVNISWSPVAFSPDGRTVAGVSGGTATLWDVPAGMVRQTLGRDQTDVYAIAFSHDGTLLAAGADQGHTRLWRRR
jgi:WD40 repeat protein/serine/threonine protein kinase